MTLAPWLREPLRRLSDAARANRLHHALLIAGDEGLGKRDLADALVAAVLCQQPDIEGCACGRCKSCLLIAAGTHPDRAHVTFETRDDGKLRSELTVDQIRALAARLSLTSQFGGLQFAIVVPADAMNVSAANALLKTLEEPASDTVIILVCDRPARLPATIRSRCQRVNVPYPAHTVALAWLEAQGVAAKDAETALAASLGNPGKALAFAGDDQLQLRAACIDDLKRLAAGRANGNDIAERWAGDRPAQRLWFASVHARELGVVAASKADRLTARREIPKLGSWFVAANHARRLLDSTLRPELLLLDLLRSWPVTTEMSPRKSA
ncbi:MAG: DNA polymerase III subunit delta' [Dokdonella sp.]